MKPAVSIVMTSQFLFLKYAHTLNKYCMLKYAGFCIQTFSLLLIELTNCINLKFLKSQKTVLHTSLNAENQVHKAVP